MKSTLLTSFLLLAGTAATAQFSLLPQMGFEQSNTRLNYGNGLTAANVNGSLKAGLRADYRLKGGHGPFVNFSTAPSPVSFAFNNAGELTGFSQSGNLRLRLEAGYQYSSKPIALGKQSASPQTDAAAIGQAPVAQRGRCGRSAFRSHGCGKSNPFKSLAPAGGLNMRLQPALGLAYLPATGERVQATADGTTYTPVSWRTALVPSMGFEFAKGRQRLLTLTVFYTQPLETSKGSIMSGTGFKAVSLPVQTRTSTWGMTLGIPIGFAKAPHSKPRTERRQCTRGGYRRCIFMQ